MHSIRHPGGPRGRRHHHPHGGPGHGPFEEMGHDPFEGRGRGPRHPRRGGGRRAPRGDVRTAVLLLLEQEPMHGYQLMQAIAERTGGAWAPSPGAVYPTLNQLEDEGLVSVTADAGRRLATLTEEGRRQLEENREAWGDPFAQFEGGRPGTDLRRVAFELLDATRQVGRAGTDAQRAAAARILTDARRSLYLLLADGAEGTGESTDQTTGE